MRLVDHMGIQPGITSIIGSGGKTSTLARLAHEAPGTVALVTTTHMFPLSEFPLVMSSDEQEIVEALARHRVVGIGKASKQGKIALPDLPVSRLAELFDFVFVEADGSKQLPLKAHASWEPVVPEESNRTLLVVGAHGFGCPVAQAVHRPELFCERAVCKLDDEATPELVSRVLCEERDLELIAPDIILVNTARMPEPNCGKADGWAIRVPDVPVIACSLERPDQQPLV